MSLNPNYIVSKFYQYAGFPSYKKHSAVYEGCCPSCREGKSWGKKKRLYYIVKEDYLYCQNCGRSWKPINWIIEQSGQSYHEIMEEAKGFDSSIGVKTRKYEKSPAGTLPEDSINLFDNTQLTYYKDNKVVQDALQYIITRRLNTAINKPRALFISVKDFIHKDRLIIPFYDANNQIEFYQTRAIYKKDEINRPKYLSKQGANKSIFGIRNIDPNLEYLFVLEGPIDSMFIVNGIAVGGVSLSEKQETQLEKYKFMTKIWILDNQLDNKEVKDKMNELIDKGEKVFIWPKELKDYKDVNEICQKYKLDQISPKFFLKYSVEGMEALMKLKV